MLPPSWLLVSDSTVALGGFTADPLQSEFPQTSVAMVVSPEW